jgi:hypothetical protein
MMKSVILVFLSLLFLAFLSLSAELLFPAIRSWPLDQRWQWIQTKIKSHQEKLDYVFIGSSYIWCGVNPREINVRLPRARIWNLGRSFHGRDADYAIMKYLLDH